MKSVCYQQSHSVEQLQQLQELLQSIPVGLFRTDVHGNCTYVNDQWCVMTGISVTRAMGWGWLRAIHPDDRGLVFGAWRDAVKDREPLKIEFRLLAPAVGETWIHVVAVPELDAHNDIKGYSGSITDITDRKRAEALLQESEARFCYLADSVPALIWLCDLELNCTYVNQTWQTFTGRSLTEELGQGWFNTVHPENQAQYVDTLRQVIQQQEPFQIELRRRDAKGEYRWILSTILPRYLSGECVGLIGSCIDIGESKQKHEAVDCMVTELQRSNRELKEFAYVASHDLREPLRKMRTFSELLLSAYLHQLDDKGRRHLNYITDSAERMEALIQSILQYSQLERQDKPVELVDLNEVVQQIADDCSLLLEEQQGWIVYDELPTVQAGSVEMRQLFQNLIGNALKYHGDQPPRVTLTAQRQDSHWRISVRDKGIGIAPEFRDRVFTMFAREHPRSQYQGTGIGLSICRKIVENYGGQIDFESEEGKGTTFFFTLPIATP